MAKLTELLVKQSAWYAPAITTTTAEDVYEQRAAIYSKKVVHHVVHSMSYENVLAAPAKGGEEKNR